MSAKYVVRVVQNAEVIKHTILQFEREVVWRAQSELNTNITVVRRVSLTFMYNSGWL